MDWETCKIEYTHRELFFFHKIQFYATAIGPKGAYRAAESETVTYFGTLWPAQSKTGAAFQKLVSQLLADGWEPTGRSGYIWSQESFRRQVL